MSDFVDPCLLEGLEYGKVYVVAAEANKALAYKELLQSSVRSEENRAWLSGMTVETIVLPDFPGRDMTIAARKVNAGNIGRLSVLAYAVNNIEFLDRALEEFRSRLTSMESDPDDVDDVFDLVVPEEVSHENYALYHWSEDETGWLGNSLPETTGFMTLAERVRESKSSFSMHSKSRPSAVKAPKPEYEILYKEEADEEKEYIDKKARERDQDLQLIRALIFDFIQKYHADPTDLFATLLRGKYIVNATPMLVVNRDRKIVLPEYDEMELKMSAASRTLYIWFLAHPEGCKLKDLVKHRDELINIYQEVHPGRNYLEQTVDAMLDSKKLNQNFSRIKSIVRGVIINDDIAKNYYISRGADGVYRLPIATKPDKLRLPQAK
ncbi:MAG: hypothetical protein Q4B68_09985 [Bacteroidales bacterium]|nr:hypothetical protein [Bacteroidales bacterium]